MLQVRKRRGARPLAGSHPYAVGPDGIRLWRRFESWMEPSEPAWSTRRAAFRNPPIDALLHGGLTEGTVTLPGHDLEADCVAEMLREDIERRGVRRLVIDSAAQLERSIVDVDRRSDFFAALVTYLRGRAVITFLPYEIARYGSELDLADTPLAVLAENLLLLRAAEAEGRLRRLFSIMHMRFSDHDHRLHKHTIEAGYGMRMHGEAAEGSAEALAAQGGGAAPDLQDGRSGSQGVRP